MLYTAIAFWSPVLSTSARRDRIRTLLSQGVSAAKIAAEVGCAPSTVHRIRNGQGSKKGDRAAYMTVTAKITQRECEALDGLVRRGVAPSRSALIRDLVRRSGGYYEPSPEEEAFLAGATKHLSRLGGNFNQIARALSASVQKTGRADPTAAQVAEMHRANDELQKLRGVIGAMLHNAHVKSTRLRDTLSVVDGGDDE